PVRHPITVHPSRSSRDSVDDASVVDFDMLQTGHGDRSSVPNTVNGVRRSLESSPKMPVLVGEVCYEGIQEASREEIQRFMFWSCLLNGAGGHTYGDKRSEEHTSELQSRFDLVCRLLLEKKK